MMRLPLLLNMGMIILLLQSCFPDDERVLPYAGQVVTITDPIQNNTSYFDLESGVTISTHPADTWHLGFECGPEGWHIITNSGADWFIYNTYQSVSNNLLTMPAAIEGLYDNQQVFPDSTAVGNWVQFSEDMKHYSHNIYLLGRLTDGIFNQLQQVIFLEVTDSTYRFHFMEQETGLSDTVTICKADTVNYAYYSFDTHCQVYPEPVKTRYDLIFGSYYDKASLFGMAIPYHVGGVLQNIWQTSAVLDSVTGYNNITASMLPLYDFTTQRNLPGYQWKGVTVDIAAGGTASYSVKQHYSYIIQTVTGNYFKLRFLSYSLDGRSGFPRFEYRQLE